MVFEVMLKRQAGPANEPQFLAPPPEGAKWVTLEPFEVEHAVLNLKLVAHKHVVEASNFCLRR